ncbi:MAG: hypothetical protein JSR62_02715 [Nitrospira sp.]|nr:hypothetical protein [Nitrospira sp.]
MVIGPHRSAAFRKEVAAARSADPAAWEASRHLVHATEWTATRDRLLKAIAASTVSDDIKQCLTAAFATDQATTDRASYSDLLKELTGLPATKGLRALCLFFGLRATAPAKWPAPSVSPAAVEAFLGHHRNPFDLLTDQVPASVLDLGAGDLSFAEELATAYGPSLAAQQRPLILHCLDRLDPRSQLGGPLHAHPLRLSRLRAMPNLDFRFYGDQDMFDLDSLEQDQRLASRYLMVTCWAPATPTFAYEPTRLSPTCLTEELRHTKGDSRQVRHGKEPALEVLHGGRSLLFPHWKFDIRGPLALLELMANRGALCLLGAVDSQVFWEILSQLVEDPSLRPADVVFSPENLPDIFGKIHHHLSALPLGQPCGLADLAPLRTRFPSVLSLTTGQTASYRFRQVTIQRGALFDGVPASSTARKFQDMAEETPPWFVSLVPEPFVTA